jgi:arylsulfatase
MQASYSRRWFLKTGAVLSTSVRGFPDSSRPNIVLILADDLGFGDLGCYGSRIPTPNLDRMAAQGARFTNYYAAACVCSPSRAALMTGRYATRTGVPRVLGSEDQNGLAESEVTLAQALKAAGYATACSGKWHLGNQPRFLPTARGFDEYFGIPYSHDMWPRELMYGTRVVEQPARIDTLTQRFTEFAVDFMHRNANGPFFLYLPFTAPHITLAPGAAHAGQSRQGLYGDVVHEMDWGVGQVLQALKDTGNDRNTLVLFASDNGPWYQGTPGRLRGRKGDSYEGGFRSPLIAWYPSRIPAGTVVSGVASALDIFPTALSLAGAALPEVPIDGVNIWPLMTGEQNDVERDVLLYFNDIFLHCARYGAWKLHLSRFNMPMFLPEPVKGRRNLPLPKPELYNLVEDPEESYDRSDRNPEIVADIRARAERLIRTFPESIIRTYEDTRKLRVEPTPVNAPPVEAN